MPLIVLPTETYTKGSRVKINFKGVDEKGPGGGWLVVDTVRIEISVPVTVSTANLPGEDQWRAYGQILMNDAANGEFFNLLGDQARIVAYAEGGDLVESEPSAITPGSGTIALVMRIPLTPRPEMVERERDFGMSIAGWKNGGSEMVIVCAADSDLTSGSSTSVIGTGGTIDVTLECHEEAKPEFKLRSVWRAFSAENNKDFTIPCTGFARHAFLHKRGASGGTAVGTDITDVTLKHYGWTLPVPRATVVNHYQRTRRLSANDPTITSTRRAFPLIFPQQEQKLTELRLFNGLIPVHLNGTFTTFTGFEVITNTLEPHHDRAVEVQRHRQGVAEIKVATAAKTKTAPALWGNFLGNIMPWKARRPPQGEAK